MVETQKNIQAQPVLDKVETQVHKEVIDKPSIHQTVRQQEIEVHERPVIKQVIHPEKEVHIQERDQFETVGLKEAQLQRDQVMKDIEASSASHPISYEKKEVSSVSSMAPSHSQQKVVTKEVIDKPIVTEVHHQPVREVHEADIHRTVYEEPKVTVVREAPVSETVTTTGVPLTTTTTTTTTASSTGGTSLGQKLHNLKENVKEKLNL